MTLLIIYFILNIMITIGVNNEGHIIPKDANKAEKWFFNILLLLFGLISTIIVLIVAESLPLYIKYKWYKRLRKIKKAKLKKILRERENEPLIRIY